MCVATTLNLTISSEEFTNGIISKPCMPIRTLSPIRVDYSVQTSLSEDL